MFIRKSDIRPFLESLSASNDVYVPSGISFEKLAPGVEISLDSKTRFSAKKLFIPPSEELFGFKKGGLRYDIKAPKAVLFGARPCDLNAIKYLDMSLGENAYYMKKRRNTILIGIQCSRPGLFNNCYCHYTNTLFADNYDVLLMEQGDGFLADAGTEAGRRLMSRKFFSSNGDAGRALDELKRRFPAGDAKALSEISPKAIKELARDCYSCTACTVACPTCQSFIVDDALNTDLESGKRMRVWDSCQLQSYTRVAGNVVFRPTREQRVRQRIMCKFRYSLGRDGMMSCTGCGRCIDVCTKGIDIFKVFR